MAKAEGETLVAQIIPAADGTGTVVEVQGNKYEITGGKTSADGVNLFHSLQEFGLTQGQIADFMASPDIRNILGRVSGGNASIIDGLIQVSGGNANLFLMNPAGIVFRPNASLNVLGSFTATTATGIGFDSGWFEAFGNNDYGALVGNPSAFSFNLAQPGSIINAGNLTVINGNLSLIGGTVINGGSLMAPGGDIMVTAVPGSHMVRISQPGHLLSLEVESSSSGFSPVSLPQLLTGSEVHHATSVMVTDSGEVILSGSGLSVNNGDVVVASQQQQPRIEGRNVNLNAHGHLTLVSSDIRTDRDMHLDAAGVVTVRDGSFTAVGNLRIEGDGSIDILAIPGAVDYPFQAGANITLVSNGNIYTDSHFNAKGDFSIQKLGGDAATLISRYDPIITVQGNASFGDYTGVSLKVEATGSITSGNIIITGPDTTLAASSDPDAEILRNSPALIMRSGVESLANAANIPPNSNVAGTLFGANGIPSNNGITAGSISTPGGPVILNAAGEIRLDNINTAGGEVNLNAVGNITVFGQINSSNINSNGGNITLNSLADIEILSINAQGGAPGGGAVDITAGNFFRAVGSFIDRNGVDASISTAAEPGNQGNGIGNNRGGDITIRHAGETTTPFVIGDATVNGTAGAITSGFETLTPPFPVPVPPRVYNSRNITIITEAPEVEPGPSPSLEFAISSTSEEEGSSEDGEEPAAEAETVTEEEVTEAEITTAEEQVTATTETQPITATSEIIISEQITTTTETTTTETTTLETTTETTISEQITAAETAAEAEVVAEAETVAEAEAVVEAETVAEAEAVVEETVAEAEVVAEAETVAEAEAVVAEEATPARDLLNNIEFGLNLPAATVENMIAGDLQTSANSASVSVGGMSNATAMTADAGGGGATSFTVDASVQPQGVAATAADGGGGGGGAGGGGAAGGGGGGASGGGASGGGGDGGGGDGGGDGGGGAAGGDEAAAASESSSGDDSSSDDGGADAQMDSIFSGGGSVVGTVWQVEQQRNQEYEEYLGVQASLERQDVAISKFRNVLTELESATGEAAGITYMVMRQEQLEIVVFTAAGDPVRVSVPAANRETLLPLIRRFRGEVTNPRKRNSNDYLPLAQELYKLLITPIEEALNGQELDTLVFSMDSDLRSLPIAALHDGKQFVAEKYSVALIPSFALVDTTYNSLQNAKVLAMGASEFTDNNPLPAVPTELKTITEEFGAAQFFMNEDFTRENLSKQRAADSYQIIHLATHADFQPGGLASSYIQLWNDKLTLAEIPQLAWSNPPIDLLVISGCRSALGNKEAELGFAGLAVKSGVRTAIASLWSVSDEGTLALMSEFYRQLRTAPTKGEALRQAQLAMIRGEITVENGSLRAANRGAAIQLPPELAGLTKDSLSHPYYWSGFTVIGSPW
ncbi:CHAT domain-containing protein [[Phormidium] sp. ETS-05]|uniref:CHAT domain-containing protein n=1 Tax=[Phormidium] sp. ETS-05 TaxID=222819 RepID=UPI0018EEDD5E|nr:CHAT domain-containing protein [[Phormidium] sp. ETS-05]